MPAPITHLPIHLQPNARTNAIVGFSPDPTGQSVLKLRLRAPAVDGKANAALIEYIAEILSLRPRHITLHRGHKSRDKLLLITGLTVDAIKSRIAAAMLPDS